MNHSFNITLTIQDLKSFKVGSHHSDFYLVAYHQNEIKITTRTQDILFSDSPFEIKSDEAIDRIEVWNY